MAARGLDFYRVEQVDGPSLLLRPESQGQTGWAAADQVIPVDQAIDYFSQQVRARPGDAFCRAARALLWSDKGEFDKAVRDYDQAIRLEPRETTYLLGRGLAWHHQKSYAAAIADFDLAIRLDPKFAPAYMARGASPSASNKLSMAIADFSEAIWLDPRAIAAYESRGRAWSKRTSSPKPSSISTWLFGWIPTRVATYCDRGDAWVRSRKFDKAIADFNAAVQIDEKCARAYGCLASIWSTCPDAKYRDGKKAIEAAQRACELTAWKDCALLDVLAAAHAETGDFPSAVTWQKKANSLRQDGEDQTRGRARLKLYEQNQPARDTDSSS